MRGNQLILSFIEFIARLRDIQICDLSRGPSDFHKIEQIRVYVDALFRECEESPRLNGQVPALRGDRSERLPGESVIQQNRFIAFLGSSTLGSYPAPDID